MKFRAFKRCIFCLNKLPIENKGEGEHVIPQNILGVWRIYDVCDKCKMHFGNNVDHLGIKDPKLVKAMEDLNVQNAEDYKRNFQYIGYGEKNDEKMLVYKDGGYRIKIDPNNPEFIEFSDPDEFAGRKWLKQSLRKKTINQNGLDQAVDNFLSKTRQLKPGEEVIDPDIGLKFVKGSIKSIKMVPPDHNGIFPLLCKIAVSFMAYIEPQGIWDNNQYLVQSALQNIDVPKYKIFWATRPGYESGIKKFHRVMFNLETRFLDISFFATLNYRIPLEGLNLDYIKNSFEEPIEDIMLVNDFEKFDNKRFAIGYKFANRENPDFYIFE